MVLHALFFRVLFEADRDEFIFANPPDGERSVWLYFDIIMLFWLFPTVDTREPSDLTAVGLLKSKPG